MTSESFLAPLPAPRLLEVYEVAHALRLSEETVRRLIRSGKLTAILIGRSWRVHPRDLQAFIDARRARIRELDQQIADAERDVDRRVEVSAARLRVTRPA